ncbi:hypothetical protein I4Q36_02160 [Tuanshanicoccus lijuaniae]|nr:hypothetical protein [Aerococcaceae bacterium zg-1292]MBF6625050.1 hypothetical protein [Aerococcaceae bacterium zg-BR9]MBF6978168.1 hypothetical protein [Aerococcaceae bacterium zg-BR22]MBS4456304.1 hypothetical protein [Aerococcaceae bacterium zg-A91]MBS4458109.1 hypothetical protein [Aerococcaceae bacterium zg-BR33]
MVNKKREKQTHKKQAKEAFVQIDAYMIPEPQAEMYRILREAVAEDVTDYLSKHYPVVERIRHEEEGEAIIALTEEEEEAVRIYLNPQNISLAQKARDHDRIDKFIESFVDEIQ